MTREIPVGIVGAGFGRYGLLPAFRRDARCRVAAACASSAESAQRFASAFGIPHAFSDPAHMLASVPLRAVAVAVPPHIQPAVVRAALDAGVAVLATKPLAGNLEAAQDLQQRAESGRLANAMDFIFPELATWQRASELVLQGAVGRIRHVMLDWRMESFDNARRNFCWKTDAGEGGGALSHFGSHCFHNLEWLIGPIVGLTAHLGSAPDLAARADTLATVIVEFQSGATGSLSLCSAAPFGTGHRIEIYGESGALILANDQADPVIGFRLLHGMRDGAGLREVAREESDRREANEDNRVAPVSRIVRRFLDAVAGGSPVSPSFADGVRAQALIDAARAAVSTRRWVRVPAVGDR